MPAAARKLATLPSVVASEPGGCCRPRRAEPILGDLVRPLVGATHPDVGELPADLEGMCVEGEEETPGVARTQ